MADAFDKTSTALVRQQSRREMRRDAEDHTAVALLEFQSPTAALIAEPVPASARYTTWILASLVIVIILLMTVIKVDRVVTATGRVVASAPNDVVQPLEISIVRKVFVSQGDVVHKGQVLAQLDPTFAGSDDKGTGAQAASLTAEVARLRAELAGETYQSDGTVYGDLQASMWKARHQEYQSHVESLQAKAESAHARMQQAQADIESATSRLVGLKTVEQKRIELERLQVGSQLNTLSAKDARLQMEGQLADATHQREAAQRDYEGAQADLRDYMNQWHSETSLTLSQQERALSDMRSQSEKAQLRHALVELRAPRDGIVLSVAKVSTGSVMQSGDEFIRIVPSDSAMQVEGMIPGGTSGFVHLGDPVTIKFDTYPFITYGYANGQVEQISPDALEAPQQTQAPLPGKPDISSVSPNAAPTDGVYYRGEISIRELHMRNLPHTFKLVPGMPVSADIKVGRRSIMSALLARVAPLAAEGLREP